METHTMLMIERLNFVKISMLPKEMNIFNAIPTKIPVTVFCRDVFKNPKIHMESQGILKSQNLEKNLEDSHFLIPKLTTKLQWYRHETDIDQWNKRESSERKPHICGKTIFDNSVKNFQKKDYFVLYLFFLKRAVFLQPKLVWLSGLSTGLQTKGSLIRFPVRAQSGLWAKSPVGSVWETTTHWFVFFPLSFFLPFSKNK